MPNKIEIDVKHYLMIYCLLLSFGNLISEKNVDPDLCVDTLNTKLTNKIAGLVLNYRWDYTDIS